jgi:hypothetical protein
MKFYKQIIFILIVFFKTETLLSESNLFNVNNIKLEKNVKTSNNLLVNQAIKDGFNQLISRILLKQDVDKFSDLKLTSIKQLVTYYQVSNSSDETNNKDFLNFNITFDKDKMHDLFYKRGVSYSEISDKEIYILPILIKNNKIFIFNNNYFYRNWNEIYKDELIEFILPLENIEVIQSINENKNNLINLNIDELFKEYSNKNLALIFIEDNKNDRKSVYIKTKIQEKNISKNLNLKKQNLESNEFYKLIITEIKKEIINLVKSENLIDIRTPSFLNARLDLNKKSNLVELNTRINKIELIENVYVQELNKDYMNLRIKYLGKLEKLINLLKNRNIDLSLINDQWIIKTL